MKISRITIKLLILAAIFCSAAVYASISSRNYEAEKDRINREKYGYTVLHGHDELNYWDYAQTALFVLAASSTIAAIKPMRLK
jgi:hypothetical protein